MKTINAVCDCKNLSEDDKVIGILSLSVVTFVFFITIAVLIVIDYLKLGFGLWFGFFIVMICVIIWELYLDPQFNCQYCKCSIKKEHYR